MDTHGQLYLRGIPTISSMIAALRTDPTLIRSGDIFSTSNCPLAKHLRKRLRRRGVGESISCVYSIEKIDFDYKLPEEETNVWGHTLCRQRPTAKHSWQSANHHRHFWPDHRQSSYHAPVPNKEVINFLKNRSILPYHRKPSQRTNLPVGRYG